MKKFLLIAAASILFPSSLTKCSQDRNSNRGYQAIGLLALAGVAYGIYHCTKPNPSSDNPSSTPKSLHEHQQNENEKSIKTLLNNHESSNPEKPSENNNNNNQTILPKPKTENKPSSHTETIVPQQDTNTTTDTQKQTSFSEVLRKGYRGNATQKFVIDTLLTEHAFSN